MLGSGMGVVAALQGDLDALHDKTGSASGAASPEIPAYRFDAPSASDELLQPLSRKGLAYTGHLDRVHQ